MHLTCGRAQALNFAKYLMSTNWKSCQNGQKLCKGVKPHAVLEWDYDSPLGPQLKSYGLQKLHYLKWKNEIQKLFGAYFNVRKIIIF